MVSPELRPDGRRASRSGYQVVRATALLSGYASKLAPPPAMLEAQLRAGLLNHQSYNIQKANRVVAICTIFGTHMHMATNFRLQVVFYKSVSGKEPVRDWLKTLDKEDRKVIGEDIKTVQFGWPLGMPLVCKIETGLWEVRIQLDNRIARILFTAHEGIMVLLHGFIKKSQKTPADDLKVVKQRMATFGGQHE